MNKILIFVLFSVLLVNIYSQAATTTPATAGLACLNTGCAGFEHCRNYQVNLDFTNYGCSTCMTGYQLTTDKFFAGHCRTINTIDYCLSSFNGMCWDCAKGYYLTSDLRFCRPLATNFTATDFCRSYKQDRTGKFLCHACENGYTLTADFKCTKGCSLVNCDSCVMYNNTPWCFRCSRNYIGTFNQSNLLYSKCFTCFDWRRSLLSKSL
jgi:hypothetical protein